MFPLTLKGFKRPPPSYVRIIKGYKREYKYPQKPIKNGHSQPPYKKKTGGSRNS